MSNNGQEYSKALSYVLKILGRRDYSEKKLREKLLNKRYSAAIAADILEFLRERNYVNEERTVRNMVTTRLDHYHWGPYKVRSNLFSKGYDLKVINRVLNEIEDEQFLHCCENAIDDYLKHNDYSIIKLEKIYRFLKNRGFSDNIIKRSLSNKTHFFNND